MLLVCLPRLSATLSVSEPRKLWRVKNIFTLRSQSHRLYYSVECNGVGEDHAQYSATRNGMKRRTADGKLLSARVIHENRIRPPPLNRTSRQFHLCATCSRTQANRYLNLGGLPARRPWIGAKSYVHKKISSKGLIFSDFIFIFAICQMFFI